MRGGVTAARGSVAPPARGLVPYQVSKSPAHIPSRKRALKNRSISSVSGRLGRWARVCLHQASHQPPACFQARSVPWLKKPRAGCRVYGDLRRLLPTPPYHGSLGSWSCSWPRMSMARRAYPPPDCSTFEPTRCLALRCCLRTRSQVIRRMTAARTM